MGKLCINKSAAIVCDQYKNIKTVGHNYLSLNALQAPWNLCSNKVLSCLLSPVPVNVYTLCECHISGI